jgi:guanylate kinase
MSTGNLVVLSAPSGTGKTSVCKKLLNRNPNWKFSVSATTRELRQEEVDGRDYIYMSNEKFEHAVMFGDSAEWEWVHGNKYGTPIDPTALYGQRPEHPLLDQSGCRIYFHEPIPILQNHQTSPHVQIFHLTYIYNLFHPLPLAEVHE